jgi:hypothetical protein
MNTAPHVTQFTDRGLYLHPVYGPISSTKCSCKRGTDCPPKLIGKHPAVTDWEKEASNDPSRILYWANQKRFKGCNWGIACGPSNIVVLDEDAAQELERLATTYGQPPLPQTLTCWASRGPQVYYRQPEGRPIPNSQAFRDLGYEIDVRGHGGQVIAPGSVHRSGHIYTVKDWDVPIAPLPEWIASMLPDRTEAGRPLRSRKTRDAICTTLTNQKVVSSYGRAALSEEVEAMLASPSGKHNDQLNTCAYKLAQLVPSGHLNETVIRLELSDAARQVGHDEGRIQRTLDSAIKAGGVNPRINVPPFKVEEEARPKTMPKLTDDDWGAEPTNWDAVTLLQTHFTDIRWAVPRLIPAGLGLLSAKPKVGKSFLALRVAVSVATGRTVLSRFPTERGRVLYFALEDGARRAKSRLNMIPETTDLRPGDLEIRTASRRLDEGGFDDILSWIKSNPDARLVIVDVFQRVRSASDGGGKKNAYAEDYKAMEELQRLANRANVCILVIHHNRKQQSDDPFDLIGGSTGLTGAVDFAMVLQRDRNEAMGSLFVSGRDMEDLEMAVVFQDGLWSISDYPRRLLELRKSDTARMVYDYLSAKGPASQEQISREIDRDKNTVKKSLERLDDLVARTQTAAPGRPALYDVIDRAVL